MDSTPVWIRVASGVAPILRGEKSDERDDRRDRGRETEAAGSQLTFTRQSSNRGADREDPEASLPVQRPRGETVRRARRRGTPPDGASSFCVVPTSRAVCVTRFLGRAHFRRRPDFATYEGYYPLQIP